MAKIKDLSKLKEGDQILLTDYEYQLKEVPALVRDITIPDSDGVVWVRVQAEYLDNYKILNIYQCDVDSGVCIVETSKATKEASLKKTASFNIIKKTKRSIIVEFGGVNVSQGKYGVSFFSSFDDIVDPEGPVIKALLNEGRTPQGSLCHLPYRGEYCEEVFQAELVARGATYEWTYKDHSTGDYLWDYSNCW